MRKLFWGSMACGVILAGGAFTAVGYAARYPTSAIGRVLHGASHIASHVNPYTGFQTVLVRAQADSSEASAMALAVTEPIPDEPTPMEDDALMPHNGDGAPIVITEEDRTSAPSMGCRPFPAAVDHGWSTPGAPATMPYAGEEESEELHMPAQVEPELLPLPSVEGDDEEEQESGCMGLGCKSLFHLFQRFLTNEAEKVEEPAVEPVVTEPTMTEDKPECREDYHHHHHYSGCPYTGRGCPSCPGMHHPSYTPSVPETPVVAPEQQQPEEQIQQPQQEQGGAPGQQAMNQPTEEGFRTPGADTMEFRSTDAQLYDVGPGSL